MSGTEETPTPPPVAHHNHTYIKRIIIKGFKSYKDQSEFDPFSPFANVIVGRNGTGKSNFFFAIRFVLSDMYSSLRPEERQALLHESVGETVMSAFVEIHFDNRDNRFPIDKEEVIIRRSIGLKKDEYFLDKKHVTKADIVNLLESAGFSKSNPYYIVQQGKVNELTLMKDSARLELLKEVAGTSVYDERKKESLKIIAESKSKLDKIDEIMNYIDERLGELEEEKEELKDYQQLDRNKRGIEYMLYTKEYDRAVNDLKDLEAERQREAGAARSMDVNAIIVHEKLKALEKNFRAAKAELERASGERDRTQDERQDHVRSRAKLELDVKDAEEKSARDAERLANLQAEAQEIEARIGEDRTRLEQARVRYQAALREETAVKETIALRERRLTELYSKQGRKGQFKNKKERDDHIKKEMKELDDNIKRQEDQLRNDRQELKQLEDMIKREAQMIEDKSKEAETRKTLIEKSIGDYNNAKIQRDRVQDERRELWKRQKDLSLQAQTVKTELDKAKQALTSTMAKSISAGLQAVDRIQSEGRVKGQIYGPLIELLETREMYMTAVEMAAGNSLFHVVVDTDETATRILDAMASSTIEAERRGRVTFMPLNRLNVTETRWPADKMDGVVPMMSILEFKPMFKKAFLQVFGKTLICTSLEQASQFAKQVDFNVNCITMDGDQVNRKGAMTGGFYDKRNSRLDHMKNIREFEDRSKGMTKDQDKLKVESARLELEINDYLGQMQTMEDRRGQNRSIYDLLTLELTQQRKELQTKRNLLEEKQRTLGTMEAAVQAMRQERQVLESELGTEISSQLAEDESNELTTIIEEVRGLKEQSVRLSENRSVEEAERNQLREKIGSNLMRRKDEVTEEMASINVAESRMELDRVASELSKVNNDLKNSTVQLKRLDKEVEEHTERSQSLKRDIEETKQSEHDQSTAMTDESKAMEKLLNRRAVLIQKREDCMRRTRELGTIPTEAVEKFQKASTKELMKELHEVNVGLKKYAHVNKKALDQYVSFTDQREQLVARKTELEEGAEAINDLIRVLNQRKDEAIERTFKSVAQHFTEVFQELVPEGTAALQILRGPKQTKEEGGEEQEQEQESPSIVMQFTGVSIRVSFTDSKSTTHLMHQLSGGQKSLVSLALIFAIQRADPAPFYLFDEIDSALDPMYRKAVADMIRRQSRNTQFILTTFRQELVDVAKKWYGISYKNGVSKIVPIAKADALRILQERGAKTEPAAGEGAGDDDDDLMQDVESGDSEEEEM